MYKYTFTWKLLLWLIPMALSNVLLLLLNGSDAAGKVVLLSTVFGFLILLCIGLFCHIKYRLTVAFENYRLRVRVITDELYRDDAFKFAQDIQDPILQILYNICEVSKIKVPKFITVKIQDIGSIDYDLSPSGKAYGLAQTYTCQIEFGSIEKMKTLMMHELCHIILSYNDYDGDHHELITKIMPWLLRYRTI